ncbi:MAG: RIP metalloprotease RseP [Mycoplasmatales bacterium]
MIGLIYFIVALGIIVLVHELGHLIVAKRNGVYCHEFSIGMGPRIKKLGTDKSGTEYSIRAIPLGGYVMMAGEEDGKSNDAGVSEDKMLSNKSAWVKIKVLVAGSFMNVVLAIFLMMLVGFFGGTPVNTSQVTVIDNSPMQTAGLQTGDYIISIDENIVTEYNDIIKYLSESDKSAEIVFSSSDKKNESIQQVDANEEGKYGITPYTEKNNLIASIKYGFTGTFDLFKKILETLVLLLTPEYGVKDLAGFVGIYSMGSEVVKNGFESAISWIAYLSINIGFFNLLPIPALDGGRLVFAFYELIFRRRANKKFENSVTYAGLFLMIGLFVFVTYNDLVRIIFK